MLQDKSISLIFAAVFGPLKAQDQPQAHFGGFQRYKERARAPRGGSFASDLLCLCYYKSWAKVYLKVLLLVQQYQEPPQLKNNNKWCEGVDFLVILDLLSLTQIFQ